MPSLQARQKGKVTYEILVGQGPLHHRRPPSALALLLFCISIPPPPPLQEGHFEAMCLLALTKYEDF